MLITRCMYVWPISCNSWVTQTFSHPRLPALVFHITIIICSRPPTEFMTELRSELRLKSSILSTGPHWLTIGRTPNEGKQHSLICALLSVALLWLAGTQLKGWTEKQPTNGRNIHSLPETCYTDWKTRPSRYINASAHATSLNTHSKDWCKIIRK